MATEPSVIIVGAGPAGTRAAQTLLEAGMRPIVLDEAPRSGGQIYRRPPPAITRTPTAVYGFDAARARAIHRSFDAIAGRIDYRPETLVWSAAPGILNVVSGAGSRSLRWDYLILATGATDRILPFPGWTLPGVFTLGGAQVAVKYQASAIGARPVFFGTGPLLYLVAYQYAVADIAVQAVLDTAPRNSRWRALPSLAQAPRALAKGAYYVAWLRARGILLRSEVRAVAGFGGGDGALARFVWKDAAGRENETACDALGFGFGLRSETQLAELCGAPLAFEPLQRQWLPRQDSFGRASIPNIYLAGDGASIRGADVAELSGERAALALLYDLGDRRSGPRLDALKRRLARFEQFHIGLTRAFPFPGDWALSAPDDLTICRCEGVTAGALRAVAVGSNASELNRVKALTRLGMGRCQGRVCGAAAAEIVAAALSVSVEGVGWLRAQPPVKPMAMAALATGETA
jgi:hydrogen cyanide synthase HcnB